MIQLEGEAKALFKFLKTHSIQHITSDSRTGAEGSVFFAIRGTAQDGHDFLNPVALKKPAACVGEKPKSEVGDLGVPYFCVKDSRLEMARAADWVHGQPSKKMLVIGVTGTSGKTTCTYLMESILKAAGKTVGVIGTINSRMSTPQGEKVVPSSLTTPGPVELQSLIAEMRANGCDALVMEVSSHALKQHRAAFVAFDAMIFTNLSRDHLDFHPDMEDYFESKAKLFRECAEVALYSGKNPIAAVNVRSEYGLRLLKDIQSRDRIRVLGYGDAPLTVSAHGIIGSISGISIDSKLVGSFNSDNIQAVVAVSRGLHIKPAQITQGISQLEIVPGRLQSVPNERGIQVLVDYAHKPDALEKVLSTLNKIKKSNRLFVVFGCGGDRDRGKRSVMGLLSVENSDWAYITSDNPRTENPQIIIEDILKGVDRTNKKNYSVEIDRRKAIQMAISDARPGDIILIAGKGHENYQILGNQKIHFDDREIAAEYLSAPGRSTRGA